MLDLEIENVFEQIWGHLDDGLRPGASVFGMAQLATVGLQGAPKVRAVIVRQVSKSSRKLAFTTDARSSKVAEIKNHPAVALSFYDRELGLQFRFEGVASIVNNGERTDAAWKRNSPLALERYRSDVAPGVAIDAPADAYASSTENRSGREGYENFCVVTFKPTTIDWLNISPDGHRRALFNFADSSWHGAWIAP